jgi:hypothetical protein
VYSDKELRREFTRLGFIQEERQKSYHQMVEKMKTTGVIDPSLVTTLAIAERSSVDTMTAITGQSQQSFEFSLRDIGTFLAVLGERRVLHFPVYRTIVIVWELHQWDPVAELFDAIAQSLRMKSEQHAQWAIVALQVIRRVQVPASFCEYGILWYALLRDYFAGVKAEIARDDIRRETMEEFGTKRRERLDFLRAMLTHPCKRVITELRVQSDFPQFLVNGLLKDASKFQLVLKAVPSQFARFNHSFPLRMEGILILRELRRLRMHCESFFQAVAKAVRDSDLLEHEARLIRARAADRAFRRTSVQMLNVLSSEGDIFELNARIVLSPALRLLKEEALNDWEAFQVMRGTWDRMMLSGKAVLDHIRQLYDDA